MNFLFDPNVAYLLLVGGFVLAILALFAPGSGLLELGALFMLVLAGLSISAQPINLWALIVLIVGVIPFILALRRWRNWLFLVVSLIALTVGSIFLVAAPTGQPSVNPFLAIFTTLLVGPFIWLIGRRMIDAMDRPVQRISRVEGKTGEARTDILAEGSVYVGGEDWSAHSSTFIPAGSTVVVKSQEGLVVEVERVS